MNLIFRQLIDDDTQTYTYIVGDSETREVAIVDQVREQADVYLKLLDFEGWTLKYLIETHVHADHVTANSVLQKRFGQAKILVSSKSGVVCPSEKMDDKSTVFVGSIPIEFLHTPGHTPDSVTLYVNKDRLLTGDCLFINSCGRTDFQSGSSLDQYQSLKKLTSYPPETLVYPGHDYNNRFVSSIAEQVITNPQLKHENFEAFKSDVDSWNLPPPRKIKESVPFNLNCGDATKGQTL